MGLLKKVSRNEPCPVCGKPDFCFWKEREKDPGLFNLYCNRSSEAEGTIVQGIDGQEYVACFQNTRGTVFENRKQREARRKQRTDGVVKEHHPRNFTVVESVLPLSNEQLDAIYRCMLSMLPLYKFHAKYLLNEGWDMELMERNGIRSFPVEKVKYLPKSLKGIISREGLAKKVMEELGLSSLAGVPGAYLNDKGRWTFCGKSGILFPLYDADGNIYRLRTRLDFIDLPVKLKEDEEGFYYMDGDERVTVSMSGPYKVVGEERIKILFSSHEGKYRNFSSYIQNEEAYKAGFIENVYTKGCEAKNQLLFAINPSDDLSVWWLTEGEKKAIFANNLLGQPVIALPGVNDFGRLQKKQSDGNTAIQTMKQRGCKSVVVAYDADRYHNKAVMDFMDKLAVMLNEEGFEVFIADWNESDGKGLDDLLASGKLPAFYKFK